MFLEHRVEVVVETRLVVGVAALCIVRYMLVVLARGETDWHFDTTVLILGLERTVALGAGCTVGQPAAGFAVVADDSNP